ncbi:MAG: 30S ribosomal protein S16, partial [bacterium]|nr:30S ribosomal protein S16 [bacterium]
PRKKTVQLKSERILYWLSKGAQSSPTCHNLFIKEGIVSGAKIKKGKIKTAVKEQAEIKAETVETAPVLDTVEKSE